MEVRLYFLTTCRKIVALNVNDDSKFQKQSQKYFSNQLVINPIGHHNANMPV